MAAHLSWLRYISQTLQLDRQHRRAAARAAISARSVLDDTSPVPFAQPQPSADTPPSRAWMDRLFSFSPRFAAHTVVISLVLAAALLSAGMRMHLPDGLSALSATKPAEPVIGDVQIQRQIVSSGASNNGEQEVSIAPAARVAAEPAFLEYHVLAEGETLGQLAALYHVNIASIFWANDLTDSQIFAAGQELRIPRMSGIPHVIEAGETLDSIAARFQVQPQTIVLFAPNGVRIDRPLPIGREIFIPGGDQAYPEEYLAQHGGAAGIAAMRAVAAGRVQESDTTLRAGPGRDYPRLGYLDAGQHMKLLARHDVWVKVDNGAGTNGWVRADLLGLSDAALAKLEETKDFPPPPPRWVWPTRGVITSPFGWRSQPWRMFHDGLDIANDAGTKIYAARAGTVFEAGWCSGFGYCVKIDHGDGITTIYGHMLKRPPVHAGDAVSAGDLIGSMGSTYDASGGGYSTGVHLHFTVKINGKAVNPLKFLP